MTRTEIRFHLDENVDGSVAVGLKHRGIDLTTTADAGLIGRPDTDHIDYALQEGRAIVTHDPDFLVLHAQGVQHAGICYCPMAKYNVGELVRSLLLVHACLTADEIAGQVEFL